MPNLWSITVRFAPCLGQMLGIWNLISDVMVKTPMKFYEGRKERRGYFKTIMIQCEWILANKIWHHDFDANGDKDHHADRDLQLFVDVKLKETRWIRLLKMLWNGIVEIHMVTSCQESTSRVKSQRQRQDSTDSTSLLKPSDASANSSCSSSTMPLKRALSSANPDLHIHTGHGTAHVAFSQPLPRM